MAQSRKISKILIANRGEIACRIMRTCRDLGIKTVAVYSDIDRAALHVRMADEAHPIGPAPSAESYLVIPKIIEAAIKSKADAIHPGYGFLSEKAPFSQACVDAGIIFLGPKPEPIRQMGDKIESRKIADAAKVPMVPGIKAALKDAEEAKSIAKKVGYPVLLKATAGGGGKGMRVVEAEDGMHAAFERASSEALKAFGDGTLYLEKYLRGAHHIEVQVVCDEHGNGIHLFERECSMQRRHQKVVEEAPAGFITQKTREAITSAALRLAKNVGYSGVGTVEFLVDENQDFYFLEMNTRLQVEHPVTELITGLDLVALQIQIGEGAVLPLKQKDVKIRGAAIECRLYAEDPSNNFFPSPGRITVINAPEGPGVRLDSGVYPGWEIPIYYDPMIAKLVTWGTNRSQAIGRMKRALHECVIGGVKHNISFLTNILHSPEFESGVFHTRFLEEHPELAAAGLAEIPLEVIAGVVVYAQGQLKAGHSSPGMRETPSVSPWKQAGLRDSLGQRY